MHQAPNSPKNIQKYIFDVKFPALSNATGRICLNSEESRKIGKNPLLLKNSCRKKAIFKLAQILQRARKLHVLLNEKISRKVLGVEE